LDQSVNFFNLFSVFLVNVKNGEQILAF